jgi:hypothetical protein
LQAGEDNDIGIGNMICDQQAGSILAIIQALEILELKVDLKGFQKFLCHAGSILDIAFAAQDGIFGTECYDPAPKEKLKYQQQVAKEAEASFHSSRISFPEVCAGLFPASD